MNHNPTRIHLGLIPLTRHPNSNPQTSITRENSILTQQRRIKLDRHPDILVLPLAAALPLVPGVLDDAVVSPHRAAVRVARPEAPVFVQARQGELVKVDVRVARLLGIPAVLETPHAPVARAGRQAHVDLLEDVVAVVV